MSAVKLCVTFFRGDVIGILWTAEVTLRIGNGMRIGVVYGDQGGTAESLGNLYLQRVVVGIEDGHERIDRVIALEWPHEIQKRSGCAGDEASRWYQAGRQIRKWNRLVNVHHPDQMRSLGAVIAGIEHQIGHEF